MKNILTIFKVLTFINTKIVILSSRYIKKEKVRIKISSDDFYDDK